MKFFQRKKQSRKDIREVVFDERAIKKAARESIKDQKKVTQKATKLRAQHAR